MIVTLSVLFLLKHWQSVYTLYSLHYITLICMIVNTVSMVMKTITENMKTAMRHSILLVNITNKYYH